MIPKSRLLIAFAFSAAIALMGCGGGGDDDPVAPTPPGLNSASATPPSVIQGNGVLFTTLAVPGSGTITSVTINISVFNAALAAQPMYDNGTNGDLVAGNNVYSFLYSMPGAAPVGPASLAITATDSNGLTASANASVTVVVNNPPVVSNGTISRNPVPPGARVLITVDASDADGNLTSVTADLTAIGGVASATLYDDGTHGDAFTADGTWSFEATASPASTPGTGKSILFTAQDSAGTSDTDSVTFDVSSNVAPAMSGESVVPSHQIQRLKVLFSVHVTDSDGLNFVQLNLTPINGSATQAMYDNGTNGDPTALDGTYCFEYTLPDACPVGSFKIYMNAEDTLGETNFAYVNLSTEANFPPQVSNPLATPSTTPRNKNVLFTITATDSDGTVASVRIDLSGLGGTATETMYDNGTNGDVTASDSTWSLQWYIAPTATPNSYNLNVTATDNDTVTASGVIALTVQTNVAPTLQNPAASVNPVEVGALTKFTVDVSDDSPPVASVTIDLSSIGGSASASMYDNGTNGDMIAGNGTWSLNYTVPGATSSGAKTLNVTATDSGGASNSTSISLTVNANQPPSLSNASATPAVAMPHTQITVTVTVTDMHGLSSVTADASAVGRGSSITMYDDGLTGGDASAGDNVWTCQFDAAGLTTPGAKSIPIAATDTLGLGGNSSASPIIARFRLEHALFLEDIHGNSSSDIYAVGEKCQVYRYDGTQWRMMDAYPGTSVSWWSVWCESASSVWVGGSGGNIRVFDGKDWSSRNPTGMGSLEIRGIWADGAGNAWAAGGANGVATDNGGYNVWNGSSWGSVTLDGNDDLNDVFGVGSNDVMVVGADGQVHHWNGTAWSTESAGALDCQGVWGYKDATTTRYWAVAGNDSTTVAAAAIYTTSYPNGSPSGTWSAIGSLPYTNVDLRGIYGSVTGTTLNAIYVVGTYLNANLYATVWVSTNGTSFSQVTSGNNYFPNAPYRLILSDAWMAAGASDVWIGGHRTIQHYSSSASPPWSEYSRGTYDNTRALDVLSSTRAITWDYPVRPGGTNPVQLSSIVHDYNSGTWNEYTDLTGTVGAELRTYTMLNPPSGSQGAICPRMYAVKMFSSSAVYGVGDDGHVFSWDGQNVVSHDFVSQHQFGTPTNQQRLYALWGTGQTDFWFGGEGVNVFRYTGSWSPAPAATQLSGSGNDVTGIWGSSNTDVYAVVSDTAVGTPAGTLGEVHHFNGTWSSLAGTNGLPNAGSIPNLNSVYGTSSTNVFIAGANGFFRQYSGNPLAWTDLRPTLGNPSATLYTVFGDSSNGDVFVAGSETRVWCYVNSTWSALRACGTSGAGSISFLGGDAAGSFILLTGSGGITLRLEK